MREDHNEGLAIRGRRDSLLRMSSNRRLGEVAKGLLLTCFCRAHDAHMLLRGRRAREEAILDVLLVGVEGAIDCAKA
ncbi:hypothetical protein KC325_g195 [Hortaea werneckii]|nr:hypothetical protein KC325_g195 [Hortaea werneckii]